LVHGLEIDGTQESKNDLIGIRHYVAGVKIGPIKASYKII